MFYRSTAAESPGTQPRADRVRGNNTLAFENRIKLVCRQITQDLGCARRPADFDAVNLRGSGQTEVNPQIALGKIAAAATNISGLRHAAGSKFDAGAESEAIALCARQLKAHPMMPRDAMIAEDHGCAINVFDYHIKLAIIEKVAHRQSAGDAALC